MATAAAAAAVQRRSPSPANHEAIDVDDGDADEEHNSSTRSSIAHCKRCSAEIGEFFNSWVKVTGSYYLPAMVGSYRTSLRTYRKPKPASSDSSLVGCQIQPLVCPKDECSDTLGILICSTPEHKRAYANRQLFKLPKIQLKSDVTGEDVDAVIEEGREDWYSTALMAADGVRDSSGVRNRTPQPSTTVGAASEAAMRDQKAHSRTAPTRRSTLAEISHTPDASRSPATVPPNPRAVAPKPSAEAMTNGYPHHSRPSPQSNPTAHQPAVHRPNQAWESSQNEAVDRLQAQVSLNRATLEQQMREVHVINQSISRFDHELRKLYDFVNTFAAEVRNRPASTAAPQRDPIEDDHFELLTNQVSTVMAKAGEIDNLKLKVALLERKLRHQSPNETPAPAPPHPYSAQRESSMHTLHSHQHSPPVAPNMTAAGVAQAPMHPQQQAYTPARAASYIQPYAPESASAPAPPYHRRDILRSQPEHAEVPTQGGWTSVNTGTKRGAPNGVDPRSEHGTPMGSPKRPKLAAAEPHPNMVIPTSHVPYDSRYQAVRDPEEYRNSRQPHHPHEQPKYPDTTNSSTFVPYTGTNAATPDDNWRPYQGAATGGAETPSTGSSPRGRGRGRGRGGRPRKHPVTEVHQLTTPEWEKPGWLGQQAAKEDVYHYPESTPSGAGRSLLRRASAGQIQANRVELLPATQASILTSDSFAHTKKTRTKPIRNADGVLIRKDGRPDMRSQSSAANLRKVHARKEEEKRLDGEPGPETSGSTPLAPSKLSGSWTATNVPQSNSAAQSHTSSPVILVASESPESQDADYDSRHAEMTTEERTKNIMKRMFPGGVEAQKARLMQAHDHFYPDDKGGQRNGHGSKNSSPDKAPTDEDGDTKMEEQDERAAAKAAKGSDGEGGEQ